MALAFNNLRKGNKYRLRNHGEVFEFWVIDMLEENVYQLKDLHTLELYLLHELVQFGKGKDYDLTEL
ncbi:hypothetical protein WG947_05905 [Pontibacter sp. H259]|uniref:hypothetical protein n=1 Tax=Pontibacter sp. H259 TaxID=3133421 RepID=UPI0030C56698